MPDYQNASKIFPEQVFQLIQSHFPEGGMLYVRPLKTRCHLIKDDVANLLSEGKTVYEIATELKKTTRRIRQVIQELNGVATKPRVKRQGNDRRIKIIAWNSRTTKGESH